MISFIGGGEHFRFRIIVLNETFNNISVISGWSVLLVEETGVQRKKTYTNLITLSCIK
jgi:hypothetical protein